MGNKAQLELLYLPASALCKLAGNPRRKIDPRAIEKLKKLIEKHGFQNPLNVYREDNGQFSIICGNHRFEAAQLIGMTDFPCIVYEGDRKAAIARAISDNKSSEWTEWDIPLLKDMLADLDDGAFDIELTGFENIDVDGFFKYEGRSEELSEPTFESKENQKTLKLVVTASKWLEFTRACQAMIDAHFSVDVVMIK